MKLALLADDDDSLALVHYATVARGHTLVACVDIVDRERFSRLLPGASASDDWEMLLGGVADCVVVGRAVDSERRAEQMRKLVAAGVPLVVTHPVTDSAILAYELEMIRSESGGLLVPYFPWRAHPALETLRAAIHGADAPQQATSELGIGAVEQLVFERPMADRSRRAVLAQFVRDADLIRTLTGEVSRIGATTHLQTVAHEGGGTVGDADYAQLSIAMATAGPLARWSVVPAHALAGPRIQLIGAGGTATLELPADDGWSITTAGEGAADGFQWPRVDLAAETWQSIERAVAGEDDAAPSWLDAARTLDLADCAQESVRRGRWIDAVQENYTEEGSYKGLMGMVGCGLLLLAVASFLMVALLQMVARQAGWRDVAALLGKWPHVLLVILCIFLALQALRWLGPRRA